MKSSHMPGKEPVQKSFTYETPVDRNTNRHLGTFYRMGGNYYDMSKIPGFIRKQIQLGGTRYVNNPNPAT